jgi:hypothetical protein
LPADGRWGAALAIAIDRASVIWVFERWQHLLKFSPARKVLMILGKPGVPEMVPIPSTAPTAWLLLATVTFVPAMGTAAIPTLGLSSFRRTEDS